MGSGSTCSVNNIYYYYNGINPITERLYSDSNVVRLKANYIYAGELNIARIAPEEGTIDTLFYHCDALGSSKVMTNTQGSQVWWHYYQPFGEPSGQFGNSHQFTGKEWDDESGLYYFTARYYDSNIGRFLSIDPNNQGTFTPYAYCANNPLKFIDPTGTMYYDPTTSIGYTTTRDIENWWAAETQGWYSTTARMSQMDPEFFYKGWSWCSGNLSIDYVVNILENFSIDIMFEGQLSEINLGRFIKENNLFIELREFEDPKQYGETVKTGVRKSTQGISGSLPGFYLVLNSTEEKFVSTGEAFHMQVSKTDWDMAQKNGDLLRIALFAGDIAHEEGHIFGGTIGYHGMSSEMLATCFAHYFYYWFLGYVPEGR